MAVMDTKSHDGECRSPAGAMKKGGRSASGAIDAAGAGARTGKVGILVAGMHRSGTSAVTRILSILGCSLPGTLLAPHPSNERGFWESPEIVDINREILVSAGSDLEEWRADEWREFDPGWFSSPAAQPFRERALTLLEREFGDTPLFVVKDPRLCRLLPFWLDVLEALAVRPLVVCPIRNPLDVAESLEARDGIAQSIGMLMWLQHVLSAEAASRRVGRAFLRFEDLLARPRAAARRLGDDLGIAFPRRVDETAAEIDEFLSRRLHHHRNNDFDVLENPDLSGWIRESFEILDRWSHGKEKKRDASALDRIKRSFDEAMPAFDRAVGVGLETTRRLSAARTELSESDDQLNAARTQLVERDKQVLERDKQIVELDKQLVEVDKRIVRTRQAGLRTRQANRRTRHATACSTTGARGARPPVTHRTRGGARSRPADCRVESDGGRPPGQSILAGDAPAAVAELAGGQMGRCALAERLAGKETRLPGRQVPDPLQGVRSEIGMSPRTRCPHRVDGSS